MQAARSCDDGLSHGRAKNKAAAGQSWDAARVEGWQCGEERQSREMKTRVLALAEKGQRPGCAKHMHGPSRSPTGGSILSTPSGLCIKAEGQSGRRPCCRSMRGALQRRWRRVLSSPRCAVLCACTAPVLAGQHQPVPVASAAQHVTYKFTAQPFQPAPPRCPVSCSARPISASTSVRTPHHPI